MRNIKKYLSFINEAIKDIDESEDIYDEILNDFGVDSTNIHIYYDTVNNYYYCEYVGMDILEFEDEFGENMLSLIDDRLKYLSKDEDGKKQEREENNRKLNSFIAKVNLELKELSTEPILTEVEECLAKLEFFEGCAEAMIVRVLLNYEDYSGRSQTKILNVYNFDIDKYKESMDSTKFELFKNEYSNNYKEDDIEVQIAFNMIVPNKDKREIIRTIGVCNESCDNIYITYKTFKYGSAETQIEIMIHKY